MIDRRSRPRMNDVGSVPKGAIEIGHNKIDAAAVHQTKYEPTRRAHWSVICKCRSRGGLEWLSAGGYGRCEWVGWSRMGTMATTLLMVRHGHSRGQQEQIVDGHQTCRGLSALGRSQVAALAERSRDRGEFDRVSAVYSSLLPRAIETAKLLRPALPVGVPDAVADCDLCEIHEPALEGQAHEPRLAHLRRVGLSAPSSPNAETYAEFAARCEARLSQIVADHPGETVLVVTHAGVIRSAISAFGAMPVGQGFWLTMANTGITEITHDPDGYSPFAWMLSRFN